MLLLFHSLCQKFCQNQTFQLFKHVNVNSVDGKFQTLIAREKAHGPILFYNIYVSFGP